MNTAVILLPVVLFATASGQSWVSHTVNTTIYGGPQYYPPQVINQVTRNVTQLHAPQPGYGNNQPGYGFHPGAINPPFIGNRDSHHLFVGTQGPYDSLLFKQWYQKSSRWMQVRESIVSWPVAGGSAAGARNITAIRVHDQYVNGLGGEASILRGGVGHRNVTLRLASQRGRGFNFRVEIYGR